jgi:hypothetical protein
MNINGVERPDFSPNNVFAHHPYREGTYAWAGMLMCSTCGEPPGAILHDSAPPARNVYNENAAADGDEKTDSLSLSHAQNALRELVLALNNEPDSWNIANAILYVQDAVDCMRLEVKYPSPDDDDLETPALSTAATERVQAAKAKRGA